MTVYIMQRYGIASSLHFCKTCMSGMMLFILHHCAIANVSRRSSKMMYAINVQNPATRHIWYIAKHFVVHAVMLNARRCIGILSVSFMLRIILSHLQSGNLSREVNIHIMKKVIAIIAIATIIMAIGCKCKQDPAISFDAGHNVHFNQETYVWESFVFPTNRTEGASSK